MANVVIINHYLPGTLGRVIELHARYYHWHWGFGLFFEAKIAAELADFYRRYNERRDGFWTACLDGRVEGFIAIDGLHSHDQGAHLRWFIVSATLRGTGIGSRLIDAAVGFCRKRNYKQVYLWTFEGLDAARHLYEKAGFSLTMQSRGTQWGTEVDEQLYLLKLE